MKREIRITKDGSPTLYLPEWDECFHSHNGAWQESEHVFVQLGLQFMAQKMQSIDILEMGLGSGLNALLSWAYASENNLQVRYTGVELYPLSQQEFIEMKNALQADEKTKLQYTQINDAEWGVEAVLGKAFGLLKVKSDMLDFEPEPESCDVVFMDAFDPELQPELWSVDQFKKLHAALRAEGVLCTYSVKGWVKRNLKAVGFEIEKHPGPPGKREVLRAIKPV